VTLPAAPLVKICGMTRRADAEAAVAAGADFLGAILAPGGRRSVTPAHAGIIFGGLPARRVGVFVDADPGEILAAVDAAGLHVVQLHGDETPGQAAALRTRGLTVWKALRPRGGDEMAAEAPRWAGAVDALLLDGFSPDARGGTGHRFPWRQVAARLDALPAGLPLVAAGGLRPENVAEAVELLRPYAVDVSSGVEHAPGEKDPAAVERFIRAARAVAFPPER
jgi:phosphoribosylanthranilate isomerase